MWNTTHVIGHRAWLDLNLGVVRTEENSHRTKWSEEQVPARERNRVVRQTEAGGKVSWSPREEGVSGG